MDLKLIKFHFVLYRLKLIKFHENRLKLKRQLATNNIFNYCDYCNNILHYTSNSSNIHLCIDCKLKLSLINLWRWSYKFDNNIIKKKIFIYTLYTKYNMCNNIIQLFISNIFS